MSFLSPDQQCQSPEGNFLNNNDEDDDGCILKQDLTDVERIFWMTSVSQSMRTSLSSAE